MGAIDHSEATLRFFGDDLVPEEITSLLGANPSIAYRKGQALVGSATGIVQVARTGSWRLSATRQEPENLEAQIAEILGQLRHDFSTWAVVSRYEPDLFCGIFMRSSNDGLPLSASALLSLGQRGIRLGLDIYDAGDRGSTVGP